MRISWNVSQGLCFRCSLWKICRRSPHHPLAGARIIPPPEAATHLGSNRLGMILDFWNMVFFKMRVIGTSWSQVLQLFFQAQNSEISRSQWVYYSFPPLQPWLTFQSVSHVFDSRYAQALGTLFKLVFLWKTLHGECENRGFPFQPLNQPRKIRPSKRRISGRLQGDVWAITWWCGTAKPHSPMIGGKYLELKMPARGLFLDWKFVVWPSFWRVDLQRSFGF